MTDEQPKRGRFDRMSARFLFLDWSNAMAAVAVAKDVFAERNG
jgi:hypothetical protein